MNIVLSAVVVFFVMYLGGGMMAARQRRSGQGQVPPVADFRGEIYGSGIFGRRRGSHGRFAKRRSRRPNLLVVPPEESAPATTALPAPVTP